MNTHKSKQKYDIIITTGGSGGHIQGALGVIDQMSPAEKKRVLFVGSDRTMEGEDKKQSLEQKLATEAGLDFISIRSGKLQRAFSWRSLTLLFGVVLGFWDSWQLFLEHKPKVVVSFGGYVTLPMVVVARILSIPIFLHEQTTSVGLTNRLTKKFATVIYISFKKSVKWLGKKKTELVGQPKRKYMINKELSAEMTNKKLRQKLESFAANRKSKPILLITGGSQGSHLINKMMRKVLPDLLKNYQIIMQTGDNQVYRDYDKLHESIKKLPSERQKAIHLTKFIGPELGLIYSITDLFIGRSGANTVYELGLWQIPSILIPIPWVTRNEQFTNAQVLAEQGLAIILDENKIDAETLLDVITGMAEFPKQTVNQKALQKLFPKDAGTRIYKDLQPFLSVVE